MSDEHAQSGMRRIGGRTRLYCVIGHPVGHSLSPAMHNAALAALGEDAVYAAFDVAPDRLSEALDGLAALGVGGANLTIPHKEAALELLDEISPAAERIGAVNTVRFTGGRRVGTNTDGDGFLRALREAGFEPRGRRAVVLGAGGSARAVVAALALEGAAVVLSNRSRARAETLAARVRELLPRAAVVQITDFGSEALKAEVGRADLLVNTTPLGMRGPLEGGLPLPEAWIADRLFVYDLVYSPAETPLLAAARRRGCRAANGLGMLAHQGALALEFWLCRPAPVDVMAEALRRALDPVPSVSG